MKLHGSEYVLVVRRAYGILIHDASHVRAFLDVGKDLMSMREETLANLAACVSALRKSLEPGLGHFAYLSMFKGEGSARCGHGLIGA